MTETRNPSDYFLIDTRTASTASYGQTKNPGRQWTYVDVLANEEYRSMVELQNKGKLRETMSESGAPVALRNRAANFHDLSHMTPEVFKYKTEDGLIWIKDKEDAKKVYNLLRKIDKDIDWNPLGKKLTEEDLKEEIPRHSSVPQPKLKKVEAIK